MGRPDFQNLRVYHLSEKVSDKLWEIVSSWSLLARETVGRQSVRAIDSIGANIAERSGLGSFQDNRQFVKMARGSLNETLHFLRRAHRRRLISVARPNALKPLFDELPPRLNAYLKSIGTGSVKLIGDRSSNGQSTIDNGPSRKRSKQP